MIGLLHSEFIRRGAIASVLYSDVGDLYRQCGPLEPGIERKEGWTVQPDATLASWNVDMDPPSAGT